jgi:uncharacterized protein
MTPPPAAAAEGPLTLEDFARLEALFARDAGTMSLEQMDGWLAALVCAPARGSVALAFGPVLGVAVTGEAEFFDDAEREEVEALLWRHWCTIAATLDAALDAPGLRYEPLLFEDEAGRVAGNEWARGFAAAIQVEPRAWAAFGSAAPGALAPVETLAAEGGATGAGRLDDLRRAALVAACAELLVLAWRHFAPWRA